MYTYSQGTVSVTNGSKIVRLNAGGSPPFAWPPTNLVAGDDILINNGGSNVQYIVESNDGVVEGLYQLTLTVNYAGSTNASRTYTIRGVSPQRQTARQVDAQLAALIETLGTDDDILARVRNASAKIDALAGLTMSANKGLFASGENSLATFDLPATARTGLAAGFSANVRNILAAADYTSIRTLLSLGTMALQVAGTGSGQFRTNSENDGRFIQPGQHGLAGTAVSLDNSHNLNSISQGGTIYSWGSSVPANAPPFGTGGSMLVLQHSANVFGQIVFNRTTNDALTGDLWVRTMTAGANSTWRAIGGELGGSGSNYFFKIAGMLICWNDTVGSVAVNQSITGSFWNNTINWNFAHAFDAAPLVISRGTSNVIWGGNASTSTTSATLRVFRPTSNDTPQSVGGIAIGIAA